MSRDARVIVLSDYAGGDGATTGGAGHAARDSVAALKAYGVDVRLVTGFGGNGEDGGIDLGGHDLRDGGRLSALRAIYNRPARDALRDALAGVDRARTLVILHQWTRYLSPAAIGLLADFPTMIYLHDHFWACPNGSYYDFAQHRPCDRRPLGAACLAAGCDRDGRVAKTGRIARHGALALARRRGTGRRLLLHLSDRSRRLMAPLLPGERHAVVYNPIAVPAIPPPAPTERRYDAGYFGRLEPQKGVTPLIDALVASRRSALFVGSGALADGIAGHRLLEHRPWQPRETMAAAMRSCRTVVLPSLWPETWGLVVPEAIAAGASVLVSTRAGSAEIVERFGGGAVFDPAVPGALAAGIAAATAAPPGPVADWAGFRDALSPASHAARIVALAEDVFALRLGVSGRAQSSADPTPRPARDPRPAM